MSLLPVPTAAAVFVAFAYLFAAVQRAIAATLAPMLPRNSPCGRATSGCSAWPCLLQ
ncbi:MAG: hypothetical protein JWQ33_1855 [Ramlibacter sp.]|nr:hypothetical protein [Ramlibacter sp.]